MGFWLLRKKQYTPDEKAARRAQAVARDAETYDAIMSAFVQPLPTFNQWGTRNPPVYEAAPTYYPDKSTYYPNQAYENPYGYQPYVANTGSGEVLPAYVDSTYNPYSRQVCSRRVFLQC
jgi:hypothetical protein